MKNPLLVILIVSLFLGCKKEEIIPVEAETIEDVLAVGDNHEGGIVFFLEEDGEHGLVAKTLREHIPGTGGSSGNWFDIDLDFGTSEPVFLQWGCSGTIISGADGTSMGTGITNTEDIISGCSTSAAYVVDSILSVQSYTNLTIYDGWYLPSKDELDLVYQTIGLPDGYYWTSSEFSPTQAWRQSGEDGSQSVGFKIHANQICAVRAF